MRGLRVVLTAALCMLAFGPDARASPSSGTSRRPPAVPAKDLVGVVFSVDPAGKELTVQRDLGYATEVITLTAGGSATPLLGSLKRGDRVKIAYDRERGHLVAIEIARVDP